MHVDTVYAVRSSESHNATLEHCVSIVRASMCADFA